MVTTNRCIPTSRTILCQSGRRLGEVGNQVIGQVLTLLLLPISIAATFYLTKHYTAPEPMIQFTSVSPLTRVGAPSDDIRARILRDHYLGEFIWKEPMVINFKASRI